MNKKTNNIEFTKQQSGIDDIREKIKISLTDDEKKKHQVVEQALDLLAKEGIFAYIYADIPHPDIPVGIPVVYQFNTLGNLMKYDDTGNVTDEYSNRNSFFHSALWKSLVDNLITFNKSSTNYGLDKLDPKNPETFKKRMDFMMWFIASCYQDYQEKVLKVLDNPL